MKSRLPAALIVDVDNTLFDWVGVWYRAFSALLSTLQAVATDSRSERTVDTDEMRRALTSRFRALHRQYGSTEYPFALGELSSKEDGHRLMLFPPERLREAAACHRDAAEAALTAYPQVRETLAWFRLHGTAIVAVSETRMDVTGPRLRRLGLDGAIDVLYAPATWEPRAIDAELLLWPYGQPPLETTIVRPMVAYVKPQPDVLRVILSDLDVLADEALYVGDHLDKDIAMARAAQVPAVWARYGTLRHPHELALLDDVCHWAQPAGAAQSSTPSEAPGGVPAIDSMAELQAWFMDGAWPEVCNQRAEGDAHDDSGDARGDRHRAARRGGA